MKYTIVYQTYEKLTVFRHIETDDLHKWVNDNLDNGWIGVCFVFYGHCETHKYN